MIYETANICKLHAIIHKTSYLKTLLTAQAPAVAMTMN